MLMRKRAWDILRDDFTRVEEGASLFEVMRLMREAVKKDSDNHVALVFAKDGSFLGVITMWDILKSLEGCVFRQDDLARFDEADWDQAFGRACRSCCDLNIDAIVQKKDDMPEVQPNDPMIIVLEAFMDHRRGWAVVREGGKVLGVIFKGDVFREISRDVLDHAH
ncbi:putative transcriptional regulator [Desulfobaculum xiamenense]|uniref:Putative transcriptional regulator n=1 Tax=Desulfobaculum xiamenense TaxID=995050 RepID=A0A846QMG2_9BACT|nr:CBS domain-containing protein [Desulfobaculum xiamenense]NJB67423.1 putative transcriptional regulator [Desulfobaculum xiamenense]